MRRRNVRGFVPERMPERAARKLTAFVISLYVGYVMLWAATQII